MQSLARTKRGSKRGTAGSVATSYAGGMSQRHAGAPLQAPRSADPSPAGSMSSPGRDLTRVPVRNPPSAPLQPFPSSESRGFKEDARPGEMLRGRTAGEFVGDIFRPVGAALGNAVGGIAAAVTGVDINTNTLTGPTWSPHGVLDWQVGFTTSGRTGFIVQEISNDFRATNAAGGSIANPFSPHYFEAWAVDAAGAVTPSVGGTNDFWTNQDFDASLGSVEGHWSTTGACYFTTVDPATQGFTRNNAATNAGVLLSSTSAPSGLNLGIARLHRYAQGSWDSTGGTTTHSGKAGPL